MKGTFEMTLMTREEGDEGRESAQQREMGIGRRKVRPSGDTKI